MLSAGVCIQALGRDQSMMGMKHRDWRPDYALIDDVEDPEEQRTDLDRLRTWRWLIRTFLPSLDDPVGTPVRALGTRRGRNSLPERLEGAGWRTLKYPIEYHRFGGRAPRDVAGAVRPRQDRRDSRGLPRRHAYLGAGIYVRGVFRG